MPFTFRPSGGADAIVPTSGAGLVSIKLFSEDGSTVLLSNLLGGQYQFVPGNASITGTAGSDILFGQDDTVTGDVFFWDPSSIVQIVAAPDFVTPFTNDAANSIDVVVMGAGNDILTLSHDADAPGNPGVYTLSMTGYGGDGNDILWMADGNDAIFGDAGNDLLAGQGGNDTVSGGSGLDTLFGGSGDDRLIFSNADFAQGANTIVLRVWTGEGTNPSFNQTLAGGGAYAWTTDLFDGGAGYDVLQLSAGNDILLLNTADMTVGGIAGTDNGDHIVGIDSISGGVGNDIIILNGSAGGGTSYAPAVSISGDAGADLIVSGSGDDLLTGGLLNGVMAGGDRDSLFGGDGSDTIYGDSQDDPVNSTGGGFDTIYGGSGFDRLYGGAAGDTIYGDNGLDTIYGGTGDDTAYGGSLTDQIFGDAGDDRLFGDAGADHLYGGAGGDELHGGDGNDVLYANQDIELEAGIVSGWDGSASGLPIAVDIEVGTIGSLDSFFGGANTDTVDLRPISTAGGRTYFGAPSGVEMTSFLSGVELIIAGAAADVINLAMYDPGTDEFSAYASNVTVIGGEDSDVVFSGSGNDAIYGDFAAGTLSPGDGSDTLFGGLGNDTIYGDSVDGVVGGGKIGNDTIYGGEGEDTLYGGAGDDLIFDDNGFQAYGGDGSDTLSLRLAGVSATGTANAGSESVADGDDRVYVSGYYNEVTSDLGAGNDIYISSDQPENNGEGNSGNLTDRVSGGTGNDVISTWYGNDEIYGGAGNDVLWGGDSSGSEGGPGDTIYGGPGEDYIYPGSGDNDYVYGDKGIDYVYWARTDGMGDQIFDEFRGTDPLPGQQATNYLVVFPGFDGDGAMPAGAGVFEVDGDITDNVGGNDMVRAYDLDGAGSGTLWRLEILQGDGVGNYIDFDQRDISTIALWNSDAAGGTSVITQYVWDGSSYVLV